MNHLIDQIRSRPFPRHLGASLLIAVALAGFAPQPAAAQPADEIRIQLTDPASLAGTRRQIAAAARVLCDSDGVVSLYRDGARRCRERVIADAERQLEVRATMRLAARHGR